MIATMRQNRFISRTLQRPLKTGRSEPIALMARYRYFLSFLAAFTDVLDYHMATCGSEHRSFSRIPRRGPPNGAMALGTRRSP